MASAKIVYASMTGNTEEIAEALKVSLESAGATVDLTAADDAKASDFQSYDIAVVATYTYGQGELPDEIQDFYSDLKDEQLDGKVYAVIGSGDKVYNELFCKAADDFDEVFASTGAKRGAPVYKIEFNEFDESKLEEIAKALTA